MSPRPKNELKLSDGLTDEQREARRKVMERFGGDSDAFDVLEPNADVVDAFHRAVCFTQAGTFDWCQIEAKARLLKYEINPATVTGLEYIQSGMLQVRGK